MLCEFRKVNSIKCVWVPTGLESMLYRLHIDYFYCKYLHKVGERKAHQQLHVSTGKIMPPNEFRFLKFPIDFWVSFPDFQVLELFESLCPTAAEVWVVHHMGIIMKAKK